MDTLQFQIDLIEFLKARDRNFNYDDGLIKKITVTCEVDSPPEITISYYGNLEDVCVTQEDTLILRAQRELDRAIEDFNRKEKTFRGLINERK